MNDQLNRQAAQLFSAAWDGKLPQEVGSIANDSLNKAVGALIRINSTSKESLKVAEDLTVAAYKSAKSISEKVLSNSENNARAVVAAACEIANAESVAEAIRIQTNFVQKQIAAMGEQARELFELSRGAAQHNLDLVNAATR